MKKTSKPYRPVILVALAILTIGLVSWLVYQNRKPVSNQDQSGPTAEQLKQEAEFNSQKKQDLIEGNSSTPSAPTTTDSVTLSAQKESNGTVTIFTKIYGVGRGTCNLQVTNSSQQTSQTAEVIYQPEYSSCAGFSVPISELGSGNWTIKVTAVAPDKTVSNSISLEVN